MEDKTTGDLWGETGEQTTFQAPDQQDVQTTHDQSLVEDVRESGSVAKPTPQESFQEIRSKAEKLQRERDEAVATLRRIEEYALQQQQQVKQPEPEPEPEYDDDDYIEGKQFKNEINYLKRELNQFKQQAQSSSIEQQLRSKYNDFDKVMTYENIAKLRELKPEIAQALHQSPDLYNKAASTYTILKEMGIHQENTYEPERERAQQNFSKPQTAAALKKTESALSHASEFAGSRLDEKRKKEIWTQMQSNLRRG